MIQEILKEKIIKRDFYLKNIEKYYSSPVVKVLTWMRRVGKSYILKSIIQESVAIHAFDINNIFYINKEDLYYDSIKNYADLSVIFQDFLEHADISKNIFVGIDEIQEIIGWEKFINSILAKYGSTMEIFITWSNSNMLSGELSTLLTGRYIEFEIFPLSFDEYSLFSGEEKSRNLFLEHLKYGGLPGIFAMRQEEEVIFNYLSWIYSTIVLKDIVKYFWLRNLDFFENLYKYVFSNIGNIFSAKSISDYLKSQRVNISTETVLNYLWYGLKVYLIDMVRASDPETKKFFEIYNKYYIWDVWLRNSLVGFDIKKDIGKLLENYAYLEIKRHWYDIKIGRLQGWQEIDFIAEKNGITKYFQICYLLGGEETIAREYSSLEMISDNWEKYVVSFDEIDFGISKGIKHINIMQLSEIL